MFIIFPKKIFPDDYHKLEAKLVGMFYKNKHAIVVNTITKTSKLSLPCNWSNNTNGDNQTNRKVSQLVVSLPR